MSVISLVLPALFVLFFHVCSATTLKNATSDVPFFSRTQTRFQIPLPEHLQRIQLCFARVLVSMCGNLLLSLFLISSTSSFLVPSRVEMTPQGLPRKSMIGTARMALTSQLKTSMRNNLDTDPETVNLFLQFHW